ncbi:MAG: choice-of-anchor tandem repeat GloVer-containing protein [Bryobacteraceae bacterium]
MLKISLQPAIVFWFACVLALIIAAPAAASEIVLHNFGCPPKGAEPYAPLIADSMGNFYGTTANGGAAGVGVVYKLDATGHETVLYSFMGGNDGANHYSGVIGDSAGNLYGTTYQGGAAGFGVVYKLDSTGRETVLYSFAGGDDGGRPYAGVISDPAGNLYGTAYQGGTAGFGVVYKLDTAGQETVLHSFTGGADGKSPYAGVIRDPAGNLYGTTTYGGTANAGVVYELDVNGQETVLYTFTVAAGGGEPYSGVIRDAAGNLYGAAGGGTPGYGVVYKLDTAGRETVLYSFAEFADGEEPNAVIGDGAGSFYGTTRSGGTEGLGVVFKLDATGHETVLHNFFTAEDDGSGPYAGLIRDSAGNLYGTTTAGGSGMVGVVFKLDTAGNETVFYTFPGAVDGSYPNAGVIRDSAGNLFGTTYQGGTGHAGVVYKLDSTGHERVLYNFTGGADGANPYGGVVRDSAGNIYGTALLGGTANKGVVYKLDTALNETVLYTFTGGTDGGNPFAAVIGDAAGNLYGTTLHGGAGNAGVVYKVDATGHETVLYAFTGGDDGGQPYAGVIRDSIGNLYGTTRYGGTGNAGVVYEVDAAGHETVLYSFTGGADGGQPWAGVIGDSTGNLYGTTLSGGNGDGVVYDLDTAGHETVLYSFRGGSGGGLPHAGVIRDSAGNLYGTTYDGKNPQGGFVYKLDTAGHLAVLYSFTGGSDGGDVSAGVIADPAGNLYGTTVFGGTGLSGVVFELTP